MNDKINVKDKKTKALSELEKAYPVPEELSPENIEKMLKDSKKPDISNNRIIVKRVLISLATAVACVAAFAFGFEFLNNDTNIDITEKNTSDLSKEVDSGLTDISEFDNIQVLSDYSEIKRILNEKKDEAEILNEEYMLESDMSSKLSDTAQMNTVQKSKNLGGEHSETYTQVDGIDEADAIKTDGENVYYILNGKLYFAKLNKEQVNVIKRIKLSAKDDFSHGYLYLSENILTAVYSEESYEDYQSETFVKSFDISDMNNIREISSFSQDGQYNDSRMKNNYLYLVTDYSPYYDDIKDIKKDDKAVPSYECGGKKKCLEPSDIYKPMGEDYLDYSIVSGLDVTKENMCISSKAYMNTADTIYMNDDNIYMSFVDYSSYINSKIKFGDYSVSIKTNIIRFSVSEGNVKLTAGKRISGSVLDQYSMDEYNGYFRIAITSQNKKGEDKNSILIFDRDFKKTGEITDIAKGESIKSAAFEGDRAYVVTYEQTDPLFTFDLSDPKNPKILSELKALGYSTHLRVFKDNLMIGFGVDADEDGIETGLKLSMYKKNSNGKTTEIDTISFGDYNSEFMSDAVYDPKALLIDGDKNIIAFPFVKYDYEHEIKGFKILSYNNNKFSVEKTIKIDTSNAYSNTERIYIQGIIYMPFQIIL